MDNFLLFFIRNVIPLYTLLNRTHKIILLGFCFFLSDWDFAFKKGEVNLFASARDLI